LRLLLRLAVRTGLWVRLGDRTAVWLRDALWLREPLRLGLALAFRRAAAQVGKVPGKFGNGGGVGDPGYPLYLEGVSVPPPSGVTFETFPNIPGKDPVVFLKLPSQATSRPRPK
jgi:hypothetical protein